MNENFKKKYHSLVLFLVVFSLMAFDKEGYIKYLYITLLFFIINYGVVFFKQRGSSIGYNDFLQYYFLFTLYCMVTLLWATDIDTSFQRVFSMMVICVVFLTLYNYIKYIGSLQPVLWAFVISIPLNYLLYLNFFGNNESAYLGWRFQGARDNPNLLAINMLFSIFCCLTMLNSGVNRIVKLILTFLIALACYLIILTASKKGIFFSVFLLFNSSLIYFSNISKSSFKLSLTILVAFTSIYFSYDVLVATFLNDDSVQNALGRLREFFDKDGVSTNNRIKYIFDGFMLFSSSPLFGSGIDEFRSIYGIYSHSNIIEVLSGTGLIGFLIYYVIYLKILINVLAIRERSVKYSLLSIIFLLFINEFSMVSYYSKFSLFILFTIAILSSDLKKNMLIKN